MQLKGKVVLNGVFPVSPPLISTVILRVTVALVDWVAGVAPVHWVAGVALVHRVAVVRGRVAIIAPVHRVAVVFLYDGRTVETAKESCLAQGQAGRQEQQERPLKQKLY